MVWARGNDAERWGLTLEFGATEILDDVLPVGWVVETTKVRLQLSAENLEGSTLSDTIGPDEAKNIARAGGGETMKLEAIGRVSVGKLSIEVGRKVDDGDGTEWALLRTNTASDAQRLRDVGDARVGSDLDTKLAALDHRARLLAFLATFLQIRRLQLASACYMRI